MAAPEPLFTIQVGSHTTKSSLDSDFGVITITAKALKMREQSEKCVTSDIASTEKLSINSEESDAENDNSDEDPDYDPKKDNGQNGSHIEKTEAKQRRSSLCSTSSNKVYACSHKDCGMEFNKPSRLVQHMRIHTGERPYECPAEGCSRSYTRQQHLKRHLETTHVSESKEEKIKCDDCDKMFSNKYSLRKHHYRYHVRTPFTCSECGQTFKKQQHLKTHTFVHTGIKPYKCEFPGCDVRCENPSRLKRHSFIHEKSRYACPVENCGNTFDLYQNLQMHLSISHMKVCDVCGRTFRQLRKLRMHRKTHEDVREAYFCPLPNCDKHFYQENNLTTHIKEKHEKSKIYQCGICDKCLASKQKLTRHMATHALDYKRNYTSKKPRKPRKDKGVSRTDYSRLLSGYYEDEEEATVASPKDCDIVKVMDSNHEVVTDSQEETAVESKGEEEMECE